jgi:hypothetical protein
MCTSCPFCCQIHSQKKMFVFIGRFVAEIGRKGWEDGLRTTLANFFITLQYDMLSNKKKIFPTNRPHKIKGIEHCFYFKRLKT